MTVHAAERRADGRDLLGRRRAHRARASASTRADRKRRRLPEDTIELIRRLAAHHPDRQIAAILSRQGRRTGTGLPFTEAASSRPPARRHPRRAAARPRLADSSRSTRPPTELGVSTFTIRRWLRDGLLPGEQTTPARPGGSGSPTTIRARFVPDIPDGYLAARRRRPRARLRPPDRVA